jgi:hypothetical protein
MTTQSNLPLIWALNGGSIDPGDIKYQDGWIAQIPSYQNFNFVLQNNSKNILVAAEQGYYEWDAAIAYAKGATVLSSGTRYFAMSANTGIDPSTDTSFATWTTGTTLSSSGSWGLTYRDGFKLGTVNVRTSSNLWGGNDLTLQNGSPNVFFRTASGAAKNWLLSNVSGNMVLVDCATVSQPDDRDISIGGANTYKLYHEGFKPTQTDVSGTIPDAPADGPIYGRSNTAWVKVTSTTVSTSPPPAVAGSGQGWYNLDDGTMYVDVNDGNTSQWVPASPPTLPFSDAGTNVIRYIGGESGTYTIPDGLQSIKVTTIAGGAAGGAASGAGTGASSGGGGGAGAFAITHWLASELPSSVSFSVGLGSTSASLSSNPGNGGGTTFYDVSLNGGVGGATDASRSTTVGRGGSGGVGGTVATQTSTGTVIVSTTGGRGTIGAVYNSTSVGGDGAGTYFGGGGAGAQNGSSGGLAYNNGVGGGGAGESTTTGRLGGKGGGGIIIIEETYHY